MTGKTEPGGSNKNLCEGQLPSQAILTQSHASEQDRAELRFDKLRGQRRRLRHVALPSKNRRNLKSIYSGLRARLTNGSNSLLELQQATILGIRSLPELLKLRVRSGKFLPNMANPVGEGAERSRVIRLLMQCKQKTGSPKLQTLQAVRDGCQI